MQAGDSVVVVDPRTYEIQGYGTLKSGTYVDGAYLKVVLQDSSLQMLLGGTVLPNTDEVVRELIECKAEYDRLHQAELELHGRFLRLRNRTCH